MIKIKFKAWHEGANKMFPAEELGRDELTINPDGRGFVNVSGRDPMLSEYFTNMIPLQYIGLEDEDGNEIYEGDIIFSFDSFGCICKYGAHEDNFPTMRIVVRDDDYAMFRLCHIEENIRDMKTSGTCLCKNNEGEFKVVGNIYENPELLTKDV